MPKLIATAELNQSVAAIANDSHQGEDPMAERLKK
jgi:hypothetical protein